MSNNTIFKTEKEKEWLKALLRENDLKVVFTKADGSERELHCTLKEDEIPEEKRPKSTGRKQSEDAIAVFDLELCEWRSFRYDSLKEIIFQ